MDSPWYIYGHGNRSSLKMDQSTVTVFVLSAYFETHCVLNTLTRAERIPAPVVASRTVAAIG